MEENNVEVMENVTITDLDDVKDNSKLTNILGAAAIGGGAIVVYEGGKRVVKWVRTTVVPKAKELFSKKKSEVKKDPEQESSDKKAEDKTKAKDSDKKSKK